MSSLSSSQAPATSVADAGLRGRLEEFGLATLLTFLDLERRSGQLLVASEERLGRVWLREGRVIRARIDGSRRVNRAAIYELVGWSHGRFAFTRADASSLPDEVGAPTTLLLVEAARRADEAAVAAAVSA
jgi:two-component system, OmpR family, response regulator